MKCIVIYFSQTASTEKVARAIQSGIKNVAGQCDITKLKDANPKRLYEYDLIGLGSPVWGAEPPNVKIFINNMRFVGGKHAFGFCTHGGVSDFFFPSMVPDLQRRGLVVIGTGDWYGDCTLYHHCYPYPTAGHPDDIDLKDAEEFGRDMVNRSRRIHNGETDLIPPVPLAPRPPGEAEMEGIKKIEMFPKMIKFHKEKCIYPECRICMDHCPMDGIDLTVKPPVIAKPCAKCEFCARICPTGALDIHDWLEYLDAAVPMMKTVILPILKNAEEAGHFRRLLPVEKIDYTVNYKRYTEHPQWVIGKGLNKP
jgi:ferredoxin